MLEGKRQKQVAGLLNKELSDIFQRLGLNMIDGGMVSIAGVKDNDAALKKIEEHAHEIKKELTARVRHQLRSMPKLTFYIDDTLEYAEKIDKLFKEINEAPPIVPPGADKKEKK